MEAQDGATRQEAKRGLVDVLREDMQRVDVTEEDEEDGERWRMMIRCGDSEKKKQKRLVNAQRGRGVIRFAAHASK